MLICWDNEIGGFNFYMFSIILLLLLFSTMRVMYVPTAILPP